MDYTPNDPTCGSISEAPSLVLFKGIPGRPSQVSGPQRDVTAKNPPPPEAVASEAAT